MCFQSSKRTHEVDVLRERTRDGMDAKLRTGVWPQKAPIGYINKERQVSSNKYERWVEPDPEFQKSMKEAWELLLTGRYTLRQICDELTKRGYTRADGLAWARDHIKREIVRALTIDSARSCITLFMRVGLSRSALGSRWER